MTTRRSVWSLGVAAAAAGGVGLGLGSCSGSKAQEAPGEAAGASAAVVKDSERQTNQRMLALEEAWGAAKGDAAQLPVAREASKSLLWKGSAPSPLRVRALELLFTDGTPEGLADTRRFLRLRLPTESQWPVIDAACRLIAARASDPAWKDQTAALVRSYARRVDVPPDPDRPERGALEALHGAGGLEAVVYRAFVKPTEMGAPSNPDDYPEKTRQAAWELLGRLDADGARRQALLASDDSGEPVVKDLVRCARELGVVPLTGSELAWVRRLLDEKAPGAKDNAAWWGKVRAALAALTPEQRRGLQLRHVEPVRWASERRPEWARASREELLSTLASRLEGRRAWLKTEGLGFGQERSRESLAEWRDGLAWGDALAVLILDEAVREPGVASALFTQATKDAADTSCEHGGVVWAADQGGDASGGVFAVRGYQPRPSQRTNDRTFIAPEEMFVGSGRSLGHYHFHVQSWNNRDYAGPGRGDLEYAQSHGRNCLVLTGVGDRVLDVDYYQRGGAVIDLGELRLPR